MTALATAPRLLTPDDLFRLPDDGPSYELVDGGLKENHMSKESGRAGALLIYYLVQHAGRTAAGWVYPSEVGFTCFPGRPNTVRKPDVAFVSLARMPVETYVDEGYCSVAPDLVAEVVSPNDTAYDVEAKLRAWLAAGVRLVWTVYPPTRTIYAHTADGRFAYLGPADTLTGGDVLPGFAVPVADLFRRPGDPPAAA